jgi:hypothetical protein
MNRTDWQGPFILSLICALADGLRQAEPIRHSARVNRVNRVEEAALRAIDFYPPAELTHQVMEMAGEFFDKVEGMFNQAFQPTDPVDKKKQSRISALIHTSVDDCKISVSYIADVELLQSVINQMDEEGIEGKSRRQVIERRIRAIKKERAA